MVGLILGKVLRKIMKMLACITKLLGYKGLGFVGANRYCFCRVFGNKGVIV